MSVRPSSSGPNNDVVTLSGIRLHQVPLRRSTTTNPLDNDSPWCYAATVDPTIEIENDDNDSITERPKFNFLASQVWPSARVASSTIEKAFLTMNSNQDSKDSKDSSSSVVRTTRTKDWTVCEWGCGPALPSLTLAKLGIVRKVIATDLDIFCLRMADCAAEAQNLNHLLQTQQFDLIEAGSKFSVSPNSDEKRNKSSYLMESNLKADLYIMSDVFESSHVALGAAKMTVQALMDGSRVWCFAQSDRSQREVYLKELRQLLFEASRKNSDDYKSMMENLTWQNTQDVDVSCFGEETGDELMLDRLILWNVDEVTVNYN